MIFSRLAFALHLLVTLLAWVAPFLFWWPWLAVAYGLVMLQFGLFGRCLMNAQHGLSEEDDRVFYTDLLEGIGFRPHRGRLKFFVRRVLYPMLLGVALLWQLGLGRQPLIF